MVVSVAGADAFNTVRVHRGSGYGEVNRTGIMIISTSGGAGWTDFIAQDIYFIFQVTGDTFLVNLFGSLKQIPLVDVN